MQRKIFIKEKVDQINNHDPNLENEKITRFKK